jgi:hypothetical protein
MPRLVNRFTGSTVNVPDEKVDGLRARGFDPVEDEKKPAKKTATKPSSGTSSK